jgi:hypothetical protein
MAKIRMEFARGGVITGTLLEDQAPQTCRRVLEALPHTAEALHAMWAGEEIFFNGFPAKFEPENPTIKVKSGALAIVPGSSSFCVFYGRAIPRKAVDQTVDVNVFGQVDDVPAMAEIGKRLRRQGVEKMTISAIE